MALVERRSNPCKSFSDYASSIPLPLLLNTRVNGLSAAHRAPDCHFGHHRSLRDQGLDRVSRLTGGRRLSTATPGASDGLYIYRRNALTDLGDATCKPMPVALACMFSFCISQDVDRSSATRRTESLHCFSKFMRIIKIQLISIPVMAFVSL